MTERFRIFFVTNAGCLSAPFLVMTVLKLIITIIITLFQEDNIFGTNASLTYAPQLQYL